MNVFLENINLTSTSGPNSFAAKLVKQFINKDHNFSKNINESDVRLCFIESHIGAQEIKTVQRLDGIYFNSSQNYSRLNENIKKTIGEFLVSFLYGQISSNGTRYNIRSTKPHIRGVFCL